MHALSASALGTVLAVWAHPDDESYIAGALLATASDAGSRVVCVTATRGERGTADPDRWSDTRLARTRTRELAAAHAVLGVDEHRWLTYDDGGCHRVSPGAGMTAIAAIIRDVQPDTIVTFGPDGVTGHPDHRAVSAWTSHAWAATRSPARLLWAAVTPRAASRMADLEPVAGAFYPGFPQVTDDRDIAIHLEVQGDLLDRKVTAIRAHASQSAALAHALGEDAFHSWWGTEAFVEVAGPTPARERVRPSHAVWSARDAA